MRNKKYSLSVELPLYVKKAVYQEALEQYENFLETGKPTYGLGACGGLCLVLPCVLWDLEDVDDLNPQGNWWLYQDTKIAFPEIKLYLDELGQLESDAKKVRRRIEILHEILDKL